MKEGCLQIEGNSTSGELHYWGFLGRDLKSGYYFEQRHLQDMFITLILYSMLQLQAIKIKNIIT